VLYAVGDRESLLSYQVGWPQAFARHPRFDAVVVNVLGDRARRSWLRTRLGRWDAIVLLHSTFSNQESLPRWLREPIRRSGAAKAYFIGNEYKLLPEKMAYAQDLGVGLLVSMTWNGDVHRLYRERLGCEVVNIPSAGLDPRVFAPRSDFPARPLDLGFRAAGEPLYFGHQERKTVADYFTEHAPRLGLRVDISLDNASRLRREEYADFLNRCRGQLATEGGTEYFDLEDDARSAVNAYLAANPGAGLDDVRRAVLDGRPRRPARMITGRQIEAAGTKTVQVQFQGGYGGALEPDVHYIPLAKDLSDADEAVEKLRDEAYCRRLVDSAYEVAVGQFTYDRLIDRFHSALEPLVR
jgi:hypothetical protein